MSIAIPFVNHQFNTSGGMRYDLPASAAAKAANTAFVLGIWVRTPDAQFEQNRNHIIFGANNCGTGGRDSSLYFVDQAMTQLKAQIRYGGTDKFNQTLALGSSFYGKEFLAMIVADNTSSHLVVCEPGGTPLVASQADSLLYAFTANIDPFIRRIGSGTLRCGYWDIEDYFYTYGAFPMVGGVPDPSMVQALADGSQDLDGLPALLTGGVPQCRYPMHDPQDLSDVWGGNADMTPVNFDVPTGKTAYAGGTIRRRPIVPNRARAMMSQIAFATPLDLLTATAVVRTEGGTYTGITPSAIQARLVKEDGTDHVGWTTVDPAPTGGTWQPGALTGVAPVASFLSLRFRAVDGGGAQIGEEVISCGLRGTAAAAWGSQGQSQNIHLWEVGALAIPDGIRLIATRQRGAGSPTGATQDAILSSGCPNNARLGLGMRQAAIEVNTLFPGLPIHVWTVGESGVPLQDWDTGGPYADRWSYIANHFGPIQDHHVLHFGHSAVNAVDDDSYSARLASVTAIREAAMGASLSIIPCETPRYSGSGSGGQYNYTEIARFGSRKFAQSRGDALIPTSFSVVKTDAEVSGGPHPSVDADGQGRSGGLQAWNVMMAAGAVPDVVVGLISAQSVGATVELTFGPVN